jgi:DNA-binding Xre family transcriptional regulator
MLMRLRIPDVFEQRGLTAYEVAKRSNGRILPSSLYRLTRARGAVKFIDSDLLEALCDVLDVEPGDLLERESKRRRAK